MLHDAGLGGITYWEVMSWSNAEWTRTGRAQVEHALDALPSPPGTGLSPHAPYSLDVEPLLEIPDIVRERGGRIHLHLGKAAFEREFEHEHTDPWYGMGLGSFRELRDAGFGTGATEFVDRLGVLGPDCHNRPRRLHDGARPRDSARPWHERRPVPAFERCDRAR